MTFHCLRNAIVISTILLGVDARAQSDPPLGTDSSDAFRVTTHHSDSQIQLFSRDTLQITRIECNIISPRGIDRATIHRGQSRWPNQWWLRLHLNGLESLKITSKHATIAWSVTSTEGHPYRVTKTIAGQETEIAKGDPYHAEVKVVHGKDTSSLNAKCFEIVLPSKLFVDNPDCLKLEWIDFYRN